MDQHLDFSTDPLSALSKKDKESLDDFEHLEADKPKQAASSFASDLLSGTDFSNFTSSFDPLKETHEGNFTSSFDPFKDEVLETMSSMADSFMSEMKPEKKDSPIESSVSASKGFDDPLLADFALPSAKSADVDFGFGKPLPPEPQIVADFLKAESTEYRESSPLPVSDSPSPVPAGSPSPVPPAPEPAEDQPEEEDEEEEELERIWTEPKEVKKDSSKFGSGDFSDIPPPVPKHQNIVADDSPIQDDFEPSQTPEPDYEPPKFTDSKPLEAVKPIVEPKVEEAPRKPLPAEPPREPTPTPVQPSRSSNSGDIEAKHLFLKLGLDIWFDPQRLHPRVESLVYWRDPKKSGVVFGVVMVALLSLICYSLISVVAYLCLSILTVTISFRIYKTVMQAVQKTSDGHPFKDLLEMEISLPEERVRDFTSVLVKRINSKLAELRRLFLVEDIVDSLKFCAGLWVLTYLGAWFNGLTLIILGWIALFSLPKVYENNKAQIDQYIGLVSSKLSEVTNKVKAAIPMGKKESTEKPKDQ